MSTYRHYTGECIACGKFIEAYIPATKFPINDRYEACDYAITATPQVELYCNTCDVYSEPDCYTMTSQAQAAG